MFSILIFRGKRACPSFPLFFPVSSFPANREFTAAQNKAGGRQDANRCDHSDQVG